MENNLTLFTRKKGYIDMHSHILPCVDDGAKSLEESILLINEEIKQGVGTIVLTPHFYPDRDDIDKHIEKINKAYALLKEEVESRGIDIQLILASEVRIAMDLLEADLKPLCIGDSNYILIEFSMTQYYSWTRYVISGMLSRGFIPIIAHAERYPELPNNEIYELINLGALIQINICSLVDDKFSKKIVEKYIKHNYVHLWGTDTHSTSRRPPKMKEGIDYLTKKYTKGFVEDCMEYANLVLEDEIVEVPEPRPMKKSWFK